MNKKKKNEKKENCCCGTLSGQVNSCCAPHQQTVMESSLSGLHAAVPCIENVVHSVRAPIPAVKTKLDFTDRLGSWKVRWGIDRMNYRVEPGLYAIGIPDPDSPVLVTANYKLSFDSIRSQLAGRNVWLMVLDTHGINVWCAAGKGTFGTLELVKRIESVNLAEVVAHRNLVLPQLGASGVCAHEVHGRSGFRVIFGPVRARDVQSFLDAGMKATPEMRRVRFTLRDRIAVIPMELVSVLKYVLLISILFTVLSGLGRSGYSFDRIIPYGIYNGLLLLFGSLAGTVFTPFLLPWLPGRAFSIKGIWTGLAFVVLCTMMFPDLYKHSLTALSWFLMVPVVTSFLAMNFTGASNFTSMSGVKKEIRYAVPAQITFAVTGFILWMLDRYLHT